MPPPSRGRNRRGVGRWKAIGCLDHHGSWVPSRRRKAPDIPDSKAVDEGEDSFHASFRSGPGGRSSHARAHPTGMHQQDSNPARLKLQGKSVHRRIEGRLAGAVSVGSITRRRRATREARRTRCPCQTGVRAPSPVGISRRCRCPRRTGSGTGGYFGSGRCTAGARAGRDPRGRELADAPGGAGCEARGRTCDVRAAGSAARAVHPGAAGRGEEAAPTSTSTTSIGPTRARWTSLHLGRRLGASRMVLVGTYRPAEVAQGRDGKRHPLEAVVNELVGVYGDVVVDLDRADGRRFVDALVDSETNLLGEDFRRELHRRTGGNALFATELLRGLRERGSLLRDETGRWMTRAAVDWEHVPARVEAAIGESVTRLPGIGSRTAVGCECTRGGVCRRARCKSAGHGGGSGQAGAERPPGPAPPGMVWAQRAERLRGEQRLSLPLPPLLIEDYLYRRLMLWSECAGMKRPGGSWSGCTQGRRVKLRSSWRATSRRQGWRPRRSSTFDSPAGGHATSQPTRRQCRSYAELVRCWAGCRSPRPATVASSDSSTDLVRSLEYTRGFLAPETVAADARIDRLVTRTGDVAERQVRVLKRVRLHHIRAEYAQALELLRSSFPEGSVSSVATVAYLRHLYSGLVYHHTGRPVLARMQFEATLGYHASPESLAQLVIWTRIRSRRSARPV